MVSIDSDLCTGCGGCIDMCPVIAVSMFNDVVSIDQETCTECGTCVKLCPVNAPEIS